MQTLDEYIKNIESFFEDKKKLLSVFEITEEELDGWKNGSLIPEEYNIKDISTFTGVPEEFIKQAIDKDYEIDSEVAILIDEARGKHWWGNIGLRFPFIDPILKDKSHWYAIGTKHDTLWEMNGLHELPCEGMQLKSIVTTNNKLLILNMANIRAVTLLEEGCDEDINNWIFKHEHFMTGLSLNAWRIIRDFFFEGPDEGLSKSYNEGQESLYNEFVEGIKHDYVLEEYQDVDGDELFELTFNHIAIYDKQGLLDHYSVDEKDIASFYMCLNEGLYSKEDPIIQIYNSAHACDEIYNLNNISLIELPLLKLIDGIPLYYKEREKELKDLEE